MSPSITATTTPTTTDTATTAVAISFSHRQPQAQRSRTDLGEGDDDGGTVRDGERVVRENRSRHGAGHRRSVVHCRYGCAER
jgi:hypothetical protein